MINKRICFAICFGGTSSLSGLFIATSLVAQSNVPISVTAVVPSELNPPFMAGAQPSGGAPNATPEQAARFAWQEFIALNWPAVQQEGGVGQRGVASTTSPFGDPTYSGPTVWETFRGKVEIFPGEGSPPGYPGVASNDSSFGFDAAEPDRLCAALLLRRDARRGGYSRAHPVCAGATQAARHIEPRSSRAFS
jgi:hypothetical protein